jgi:hypothetical protein
MHLLGVERDMFTGRTTTDTYGFMEDGQIHQIEVFFYLNILNSFNITRVSNRTVLQCYCRNSSSLQTIRICGDLIQQRVNGRGCLARVHLINVQFLELKVNQVQVQLQESAGVLLRGTIHPITLCGSLEEMAIQHRIMVRTLIPFRV